VANIEYVAGSREYITVDVEVDDATFNVADWTGALAFTAIGDAFASATATWIPAALAAGADTQHFTAKVMQGTAPILAAGAYFCHVKLTNSAPGTELPILPAQGTIKVV